MEHLGQQERASVGPPSGRAGPEPGVQAALVARRAPPDGGADRPERRRRGAGDAGAEKLRWPVRRARNHVAGAGSPGAVGVRRPRPGGPRGAAGRAGHACEAGAGAHAAVEPAGYRGARGRRRSRRQRPLWTDPSLRDGTRGGRSVRAGGIAPRSHRPGPSRGDLDRPAPVGDRDRERDRSGAAGSGLRGGPLRAAGGSVPGRAGGYRLEHHLRAQARPRHLDGGPAVERRVRRVVLLWLGQLLLGVRGRRVEP